MNVRSFVTIVLSAAAFKAVAQKTAPADTILRGSAIEVIQAYKPEIKPAPKPEWIPQLPPPDTVRPSFNFDVPQQTLYYTYSSLPLRPLALGKDVAKLPFANYVKLGGGNLSTIFLDAGIGSLKGGNYETAIHLHHLSQKGSMADQQSAISGIEADGTYHADASDWHAGLSAERNQYKLYGGDLTTVLPQDSMRKVYTSVRAMVDMRNKPGKNDDFSYDPGISASIYTGRTDASEISLGFATPVSYKASSNLDITANLFGVYTTYKAAGISQGNSFAELLPGLLYHTDNFGARGALGLALGKGSKAYILPDLAASYTIPDTKFTVSAGWQALLRQNTFEQLSTINPFIYSYDTVNQTRSDDEHGELKGSVGDHLSFFGRVSWWNYAQLPAFLNDLGDRKQFYVHYLNATAVSVRAGVRYHVADSWTAGATADFFIYNTTEKYVWGLPAVNVKADITAIPVKKLTTSGYIALLGGIHARDIAHNVVNLNMIADIGVNAEYQFIPRLSAFAQVSDLLGSKYQYWYTYPVYGINIYGGIRLKF